VPDAGIFPPPGRSTLGKVTNAGTNFSFTDYNAETPRFYRLLVP